MVNRQYVNRSTALVLAGIGLLLASAAVPLVGLVTSEWESDYVYTIESDESYCADVVHETPDTEGTDDFRVAYENLSETGRQHFDRALADGRYVVEDEADVAPDFQFTDDHVAAGEGCYAITHEGDTHALRTSQESQRVGPADQFSPFTVGVMLLVLGIGALLASAGLVAKRQLE